MELLGQRPVWSMDGSQALSAVDSIEALVAQLKTYQLQLIGRLDEIGHAQELGARDTAELVALRYRMDRPEARRLVRLAQALPKYPAVAEALPDPSTPVPAPDGTDDTLPPEILLRPDQAAVIVSALEKVPTTVSVDELRVAEEQLVGLARLSSPSELRKAAQLVRDLLDADGPEPDEQKAYARERLNLVNDEHGVKFTGYLANDNAERLRAAIHAGARPHRTADGELDPRSREKRQADALSSILSIAAAVTDAGLTRTSHTTPADTSSDPATPPCEPAAAGQWVPGFGAKTNLVVTIDWQDLKAATPNAIGSTVYGGGLSAATLRRLACDAKIIPLVLGSKSEPLDVGRAERLVTLGMRRALNTRDQGCVICNAPPVQCDAHHLISWIDGGTTAVSNLVLLCRMHHVDLHAGKWIITIVNDQVQVARPSWADPPSRGPSRHTPTGTARAEACASTEVQPHSAHAHAHASEPAARPTIDSRTATRQAIWGEDPPAQPPTWRALLADPDPTFNPWADPTPTTAA